MSAACADAALEPPSFRFARCGQLLRRAACEARDRRGVKARGEGFGGSGARNGGSTQGKHSGKRLKTMGFCMVLHGFSRVFPPFLNHILCQDYSKSFDFLRFVVVVSEDDVWQCPGQVGL